MQTRFIHLITIAICLLIFADYNYAPRKIESDKVVSLECNEGYSRRGRSAKPRTILEGKKGTEELPLPHCVSLSEGDVVVFTKSAITGALSTITIPSTAGPLTYDISFLSGLRGSFYLGAVILLALVFFVFYNHLGNETGRIRLAYFLLLCSIALLVEHVFNVF